VVFDANLKNWLKCCLKTTKIPVDSPEKRCYNRGIVSNKEQTMGWIKDGEQIKARYLGELVSGTVESSRVKYGGSVQYTVVLDRPVQFRWRSEPSTRVLVDDTELVA
jgi:hypothetical protein